MSLTACLDPGLLYFKMLLTIVLLTFTCPHIKLNIPYLSAKHRHTRCKANRINLLFNSDHVSKCSLDAF